MFYLHDSSLSPVVGVLPNIHHQRGGYKVGRRNVGEIEGDQHAVMAGALDTQPFIRAFVGVVRAISEEG